MRGNRRKQKEYKRLTIKQKYSLESTLNCLRTVAEYLYSGWLKKKSMFLRINFVKKWRIKRKYINSHTELLQGRKVYMKQNKSIDEAGASPTSWAVLRLSSPLENKSMTGPQNRSKIEEKYLKKVF